MIDTAIQESIQKYNYDFSNLQASMFKLKNNQSEAVLESIRRELNKFFKNEICEDIIYTKNIDKLFFGMCCMPIIKDEDITEILFENRKPYKINKYVIEFDSKLFEIGLSTEELTALLLHEVGHMVNNTMPVQKTRDAIAMYLAKEDEVISLKDSIHEKSLMMFAIKDSIRRFSSIFACKDQEIIADEFVVRCGYGQHLETAFSKIVKNTGTLSRGVTKTSKLAVLEWTLKLYKNLGIKRLYAVKVMNKGKSFTGSRLEKREIDRAIQALDRMKYMKETSDEYVLEQEKRKISLFNSIRRNGMKNLENDVYEYTIRIKNVSEEEEALFILRQINMRMSIIDDYLNTEKIDEQEKQRWYKLRDKYDLLRTELSKKAIYDKKMYGLFIDYSTL